MNNIVVRTIFPNDDLGIWLVHVHTITLTFNRLVARRRGYSDISSSLGLLVQ